MVKKNPSMRQNKSCFNLLEREILSVDLRRAITESLLSIAYDKKMGRRENEIREVLLRL